MHLTQCFSCHTVWILQRSRSGILQAAIGQLSLASDHRLVWVAYCVMRFFVLFVYSQILSWHVEDFYLLI